MAPAATSPCPHVPTSPGPLAPTGLSVQWGQEPRAGVARCPQALPAAAFRPSANRAHSIDFFFPFFLFPRSMSIKIKAVLSPLVGGPGGCQPHSRAPPRPGLRGPGNQAAPPASVTAGRLPYVEQSLLNNLSRELHYSSTINYSLGACRADPGGESAERLAQRARPWPCMRCTGAACAHATDPCLCCCACTPHLGKTQVYLITLCVIFKS